MDPDPVYKYKLPVLGIQKTVEIKVFLNFFACDGKIRIREAKKLETQEKIIPLDLLKNSLHRRLGQEETPVPGPRKGSPF
jgi:hypothetical protein